MSQGLHLVPASELPALADELGQIRDRIRQLRQREADLNQALLALAIVDPGDPTWQVIAFLLGGGAAFAAHAGKASARAAVNTSPEPVSNLMVSTAEDVATAGLLALAIANPVIAGVIALVLLILSIVLIFVVGRAVRGFFSRTRENPDPG